MSSFTSRSDEDPTVEQGRQAKAYLIWVFGVAAICWILAWIYVYTMPMAFLSRDYPLWVAKKAMMDACNLGSVEVVGDSRAVAAVMPGVMAVKTTNLAMSGTGPIESYFTVNRTLQCQDHPKTVIFAHGAPHFDTDLNFWGNAPLLGILGYDDLRDMDRQAARLGVTSDRGAGLAQEISAVAVDWLYKIGFPPLYFASLTNGYFAARWWYNLKVLDDTMMSRGQAPFGMADGSDGLADEGSMSLFKAAALSDHYFTRMLTVLRKQGVKVLFVAMPMNQSTFDKVAPEVEAGFMAYLQEKARAFDNFQVVGPPIACWPDAYFGDAWHFNLKGAEAYSRDLGNWLQAMTINAPAEEFHDRCDRSTRMATRKAGPHVEPRPHPNG